jgi:hypothetical protein
MKTVYTILVAFFLGVTLCSCPYSSPFKLDDTPTIYVEDALLGKWATFVKRPSTAIEGEEPVKLILSKKNETEYNIVFIGFTSELKPYNVATADSVRGTAFMSTVGGRQFLNINIKSKIYIAELKFQDDKLSVLPLVEHFTSKMIFSNTALRNSVDFHYKSRVHPMYDDDFCLKDMVRVN